MVKDAKRDDTGPYTVVLKNPSGSAEATVKVTVIGTTSLHFVDYLLNNRHIICDSSDIMPGSHYGCMQPACIRSVNMALRTMICKYSLQHNRTFTNKVKCDKGKYFCVQEYIRMSVTKKHVWLKY